MVTTISLGICLAGEVFLLYCLFHFIQEAVRISRSNKLRTAELVEKQDMSHLQVIEALSSAVWAEGRWMREISDHSLAFARPRVSPQAKS